MKTGLSSESCQAVFFALLILQRISIVDCLGPSQLTFNLCKMKDGGLSLRAFAAAW